MCNVLNVELLTTGCCLFTTLTTFLASPSPMKMADSDEDLPSLYDKLQVLSPSYKELLLMPGFHELIQLRDDDERPKLRVLSRKVLLFVAVPAVILMLSLLIAPPTQAIPRALSWAIGKTFRHGVADDHCLIRSPAKFVELFRPPVDCNVCRDIHQVDVVDQISRTDFTEKYAYTSRPLVVRQAMKNWTASQVFSFDYLRKLYMEEFPGSLDVLAEHCQFFGYKTEFHNLRDVFRMSRERFDDMWYVGFSNCDVSVADALRRHYSRPAFLPEGTESSRLDWIFMGRPGYGAHLHVDNVGRPSWQAQIRGIKKWTLAPPPECSFECTSMDVTVHPNDIIVLDTDTWYHSTLILGNEISITIGSEFD